jgi:DNA repair protein RecO (recombination protein O)
VVISGQLTGKYTKKTKPDAPCPGDYVHFINFEKRSGMVDKTSGIVLNQIKYTDSGIVTQIFTRKFGRQSFLIKGIRNKKSGKHAVFFRPLTQLDLVIYYKESRSMQTIKEISVEYAPADIYSNVLKSSIAIFIGEVLTLVLREEGQQDDLFSFIKDSIIYLDKRQGSFSNFHIAFLTGLCSFLGFEPGRRNNADNKLFDLVNGTFVAIPPAHGIYSDIEISGILAEFFQSSWDNMNLISLSGKMRNEVLSELLRYYSVHLPSFGKINSIGILKEVFS